ncbi:glycerol-3-phosphate dehydrogenase [Entomophthora muscae]|uniref:Glycerol-3-phosphate dehydrogenase n=1 Tax=Entomophthora muscae TaxID=34485 RepID=A0ACC2SDN7_9FUNG|nr:glycerol-3-phosphate dehydrogenase [Entomophthora muscae]
MTTEKVCIIGSGNWGSAIAKIIGRNVSKHAEFSTEVNMWVYEEQVNGRRLTEIINTDHINVKYLPGIKLPENVIAVPDVKAAAANATTLVFVLPHQFIGSICKQLKGTLPPNCKAISLIKGVSVNADGISMISDLISSELDIEVSTLSGANISSEVAEENFCETTIGYRIPEHGHLFKKLFHTEYFHVNIVPDVHGVEMCGALKNVVAIAAGIVDGLKLGNNSKAAIIRIGLMEMKKFSESFLEGVAVETFFESCGVADLTTTCYGGRNRKVAEAFVTTGKPFDVLEKEMLNGQKLQGTITAKEVNEFLSARGLADDFPLFTRVYQVCYENLPAKYITHDIEFVKTPGAARPVTNTAAYFPRL